MPDLSRPITITTGTIINFFLIGALVVLLYYLFDVVLVVLTAIVIASAIEPVVHWLKRYHIPRIVSVILLYLVIAAAVAALFIYFIPTVLNDAVGFLDSLPRTISIGDIWNPIQNIGFNIGDVSSTIGDQTIQVSNFASQLQSILIGTSAGAFRFATIFFGGALSFILIMVLSFYLSVQEGGVEEFLRIITPVKYDKYIVDLWQRSQRKIAYWFQGQILLGIIIGVLVYISLKLVGVPHPVLLALLAGALEIIPVFGPVIAAIPAILIGFTEMGAGTGLILVAIYVVIQQLENQLIYPLVVKKIVGISPIVVIIALVIGGKLAGVLGAIVFVPLSAALLEYARDVEKRKKLEMEAAPG